MTPATIEVLDEVDESSAMGLAHVLMDCVQGGASVSFMAPLTFDRAMAFWRQVATGVSSQQRALLVARDAKGICGTVQLILEQPENQPHRADLAKLLVHRRARRQGIGARLMRAAEQVARDAGKTLLVLDTADAGAAALYLSLGWQLCGVVPDYALLPTGGLCDTTFFYRNLNQPTKRIPAVPGAAGV
jgi:GNAT superfamily N-acetyltransferase